MDWEKEGYSPLVLVADDDRAIRTALKTLLERAKYRVEVVSNGREAVQAATNLRPDLILMDVKMPLMDGFEAVQLIRSDPLTIRIPVIFLTAVAQSPDDAARGITLGADDYLHKPFGVDELMARVRRKIRDRQMEERLHQRTLELESLIHIGSQLNDALTIEELADRVLALTLNRIASHAGSLMIRTATDEPIIYFRYASESLQKRSQTFSKIPMIVIERSEPVMMQRRDEIQQYVVDPAVSWASSVISVPLLHSGELLGVLSIGDDKEDRYSENDLRLMRSIAEQAALALRNTELYAELRLYTNNLESMVETRTQELMLTQRQLLRAEKLAAIGTLAAGIAHEVNNPLQPILMNLETMLEDLEMGKPVNREDVVHSHEQVVRISALVRRLLNLARPERQAMDVCNLNEIVEDLIVLTSKQLEYTNISIEWKPGKIPAIIGNVDQLKQVILNLIVNARDAMPGGGTLTLRTTSGERGAVLRVEDTGIGIAPEMIEKIFDPFYTTKAEGTGLGLPLSYQIIEGHGGRFEVSSTVGKGTQFRIFLPATERQMGNG